MMSRNTWFSFQLVYFRANSFFFTSLRSDDRFLSTNKKSASVQFLSSEQNEIKLHLLNKIYKYMSEYCDSYRNKQKFGS